VRHKRYGTYDWCGSIPNQTSIDERPAIVAARRRLGDWEGDTVISKGHQGALVTLVERKSLFTVIRSHCGASAELSMVWRSGAYAGHVGTIRRRRSSAFW